MRQRVRNPFAGAVAVIAVIGGTDYKPGIRPGVHLLPLTPIAILS